MKDKEIFKIINRESGCFEADKEEFNSLYSARNFSFIDIYLNKSIYKIQKYKVTYTLIDGDVDDAEDVPIHVPDNKTVNEKWKERRVKAFIDALFGG